MSGTYQKALLLLKKWPVNPLKGSCDFGLHLRTKIQNAAQSGEIFPGDAIKNEKMVESLLRMAENKCGKKYEPLKMGGSGLEKEFIQKVLEPHSFNKVLEIRKGEEQ